MHSPTYKEKYQSSKSHNHSQSEVYGHKKIIQSKSGQHYRAKSKSGGHSRSNTGDGGRRIKFSNLFKTVSNERSGSKHSKKANKKSFKHFVTQPGASDGDSK